MEYKDSKEVVKEVVSDMSGERFVEPHHEEPGEGVGIEEIKEEPPKESFQILELVILVFGCVNELVKSKYVQLSQAPSPPIVMDVATRVKGRTRSAKCMICVPG